MQAQEIADNTKHDRGAPLPVVSLEDFFEGNDDYGSIGCNLPIGDHPGPNGFYSLLKAVRDKAEVQDVLVEIDEVEDDTWPFSERVYIITSAAQSKVAEWLKPLSPDEVDEGIQWDRPAGAFPALLPEVEVYAAWWD